MKRSTSLAPKKSLSQKQTGISSLSLAALGVVFGDIGTSPLYTFQTALQEHVLRNADYPLGVASLIIWSLLAIVTCKYVLLVMKADYHGEGGVFALLALLRGKNSFLNKTSLPLIILFLLFGAALLYGDGAITPAISVLSAVEGLHAIHPSFSHYILPITLAILLGLFMAQHFGTGNLGKIFGIVMLVWFLFLGISGAIQIIQVPKVLNSLNPYYAWMVIKEAGTTTVFLLASVVLAITGVEALYADLGHFGRKAIALAWNCIVLPCLLLNYLGQAAIALKYPEASQTGMLFFLLVPRGIPTIALVILSTLATVIASQALISGVFSLTAQARELGFLPRFLVKHTSRFQQGQVYLPSINWILATACLLLVLIFRSSNNLAAAYGLAVIGTMIITSIAFSQVFIKIWHRPRWLGITILILLLSIELPFLFSSLSKLLNGGSFPLGLALSFLGIMVTWHKGRALIRRKMLLGQSSLEALIEEVTSARVLQIPGTFVVISSSLEPHYSIAHVFEWVRRTGCLRKNLILVSLLGSPESSISLEKSLQISSLTEGLSQRLDSTAATPSFWHIIAHHGTMQETHVMNILRAAAPQLPADVIPEEAFFLLPRESIIAYTGKEMSLWQRKLFSWLSRNNATYSSDSLSIPYQQIIEFSWIMKV